MYFFFRNNYKVNIYIWVSKIFWRNVEWSQHLKILYKTNRSPLHQLQPKSVTTAKQKKKNNNAHIMCFHWYSLQWIQSLHWPWVSHAQCCFSGPETYQTPHGTTDNSAAAQHSKCSSSSTTHKMVVTFCEQHSLSFNRKGSLTLVTK